MLHLRLHHDDLRQVELRNKARRRGSLVAVLATLLFMTVGATAAHAAPAPPSQHGASGPISVTVGPQNSAAADTVITCYGAVNRPLYSGNAVIATGAMTSCSPSSPYACNTEIDLEVYLSGPGRWATAATSGTVSGCPPPSRSASAAVNCSWAPDTYSYRTRIVLTAVYTTTKTVTGTSDVLDISCF